jgi:ATP-dependent RNA helicase DDX49/DBP8
VQKAVIPAILKGQDCIGVAKTGSGKTAAFVLPVIHRLVKERYGVYALVLTPTR